MMWNRMFGPMGWSYWVLITCNIALPQLMWLRKFRVNVGLMFLMSLIVNTGMWFERFVIVVTSLTRDYLDVYKRQGLRRHGEHCAADDRSAVRRAHGA